MIPVIFKNNKTRSGISAQSIGVADNALSWRMKQRGALTLILKQRVPYTSDTNMRASLWFENVQCFNTGDYNPKVMIDNYTPVEEGYIRCATVQSEAMLAKLLSEGTYKPSRSELEPHSMTSGCSACYDENQWCWSDAHTWMYEQCAEKLGIPEMDAGIWLYAHDDEIHNFKEAYNFGLEKEGMVLLLSLIHI